MELIGLFHHDDVPNFKRHAKYLIEPLQICLDKPYF